MQLQVFFIILLRLKWKMQRSHDSIAVRCVPCWANYYCEISSSLQYWIFELLNCMVFMSGNKCRISVIYCTEMVQKGQTWAWSSELALAMNSMIHISCKLVSMTKQTNDNTIVTSFAHHMALSSVHLWSLTAEFHTSLFCFVPEAKHKHSRPFWHLPGFPWTAFLLHFKSCSSSQ